VTLEDIELSNENLLKLKQFRPNEKVVVEITPFQPSIFDVTGSEESQDSDAELYDENNLSLSFAEDEENQEQGTVLQEWSFDGS